MRSKITSKFQTTIPREIRDKLKLHVADVIEWRQEGSRIYVEAAEKPFLKYQSSIRAKAGDAKSDIKAARKIRAKKIQKK